MKLEKTPGIINVKGKGRKERFVPISFSAGRFGLNLNANIEWNY